MRPGPADDEAIAAFARDGIVCLCQVLDADQVAAAARARSRKCWPGPARRPS